MRNAPGVKLNFPVRIAPSHLQSLSAEGLIIIAWAGSAEHTEDTSNTGSGACYHGGGGVGQDPLVHNGWLRRLGAR